MAPSLIHLLIHPYNQKDGTPNIKDMQPPLARSPARQVQKQNKNSNMQNKNHPFWPENRFENRTSKKGRIHRSNAPVGVKNTQTQKTRDFDWDKDEDVQTNPIRPNQKNGGIPRMAGSTGIHKASAASLVGDDDDAQYGKRWCFPLCPFLLSV